MKKERLGVLSSDALREIADRAGIKYSEYVEKDVLIEQILEALEEDRTERETSNNAAMKVEGRKFSLGPEDELAEDLYEYSLPESYDDTHLMLLLRDPFWAFAYWDVSDADLAMLSGSKSKAKHYLRVHEIDETARSTEGSRWFDIPVKDADRSRYIHLPRVERRYVIELHAKLGRTVSVLCRSNGVWSPSMRLEVAQDDRSRASFTSILAVSGIQEPGEAAAAGGIPQRIISLLDTQYLHLQG